MKRLALFFVWILMLKPLYAQDTYNEDITGEYTVISTNGLNLRSAPGSQSKVLKRLSFGTKVTVLENKYFRRDTIGAKVFYHGNRKSEHPIIGHWVKVLHKNTEGFLFDPYLENLASLDNYQYLVDDSEKYLNKDFVLLFPGEDCYNNFWPIEGMNLLGCYKDGDGFKLKKIELSYYKSWIDPNSANAEMEINLWIGAKDNKDLLFIVGSKGKLKEGKLSGVYGSTSLGNIEQFEKLDVVGSMEESKLILKESSKKQVLNPKSPHLYPTYTVIWEGDLDFDGKLDYIISFGDKSQNTYLFLSSQAEEGELVKPVAVFFSGYCC